MAIKYHHERFDGTGYPAGLKGENIPLDARIMAVADSFDAMISDRPYRKSALPVNEALEELKRNAGTQFDPKIVEVFLELQKNKYIINSADNIFVPVEENAEIICNYLTIEKILSILTFQLPRTGPRSIVSG